MNTKVYIAVPLFNRYNIAELCLPMIATSKAREDMLVVYDDGSTDQSRPGSWVLDHGVDIVHTCQHVGIDAQRRRHFTDFLKTDCSHLYLTDADALHDPLWRQVALASQQIADGRPVCLYNTRAHSDLQGNTLEDKPQSRLIWRYYAPGISFFLTRVHAEEICRVLPAMPPHWDWDWAVSGLLGGRMAVTRTSWVDHIGYLGLHHPEGAGVDAGDRATNPSPWLVAKRAEVIKKLST